MKPFVLKIGGSLAETGRLEAVVARVARARRPLVLVPGGGKYADEVRARQRTEGFPDGEAHRLAILAMHRTAADMIEMQPRLAAAEGMRDIRALLRGARIPVWLPARMALADMAIPRDWSITSDGLAARLAERMGGLGVLLLKSVRVRAGAGGAALAASGVVDPAFPVICRRAGLWWRVLGPGDERQLEGVLSGRLRTSRALEIGSRSP